MSEGTQTANNGAKAAPINGLAAAAFIVATLWLFLTPVYFPLMGHKSAVFRSWTMFSGMGVSVNDVKYFQHLPDGSQKRIDRYEVLGYEDRGKAPLWLRRIRYNTGVHKVGRQLCRKLGHDADVRAISRVGRRSGWQPGYRGKHNLCQAPEPRRYGNPERNQ